MSFLLGLIISQPLWAQESTTIDESNESDDTESTTDSTEEQSSTIIEEPSSKNTEDSHPPASPDLRNELSNPPQTPFNSSLSLNPEDAQSLDTQLTDAQLKWLKPSRGKLPQNPYQHVDFTAYTLEWGEVQLGLNRSSLGILPRTQISTQVPLWALGVNNVSGKVNLLRAGPFDLAITGNYLSLPSNNFAIQYSGVGAFGSLRLTDNWSIHTGGQRANLHINGIPDISQFNHLLVKFGQLSQSDIDNFNEILQESVQYERQETIFSGKLATDIRLNRRDSFILQGNMMYSENQGDGLKVNIQDTELSLDDFSSPIAEVLFNPKETSLNYGGSLAYQASFKRAYVRLGIGYSNIPYMWTLQSIDFTWRLGGKTKRRANNMEKVWELNKKALKSGADQR